MRNPDKRGGVYIIQDEGSDLEDDFDEDFCLQLESSDSDSSTEELSIPQRRKGKSSTEGASSSTAGKRKKKETEVKWERLSDYQENPVHLSGIPDFTGSHTVIGCDNLSPYEVFLKMFPEEIFDLVANETNRYANSFFAKNPTLTQVFFIQVLERYNCQRYKSFYSV